MYIDLIIEWINYLLKIITIIWVLKVLIGKETLRKILNRFLNNL